MSGISTDAVKAAGRFCRFDNSYYTKVVPTFFSGNLVVIKGNSAGVFAVLWSIPHSFGAGGDGCVLLVRKFQAGDVTAGVAAGPERE